MADVIEYDNQVVIYSVIEGPFHSSEIPDWDEEDDCWLLLCQVENSYGALEAEELAFSTFDEAYEIVKHFKKNCFPFIMEVEEDEDEDAPNFPHFLIK